MIKILYFALFFSTQALALNFEETLKKGHQLFDEEMYQESYNEYQKLLESNSQLYKSYGYYGMGSSMYYMVDKEDEAIQIFTKIVEDDFLLRELSYSTRVTLYQRLGWLNSYLENYPYSFRYDELAVKTYEDNIANEEDDSFYSYCESLYNLGYDYVYGVGIEQNYEISFKYFKKSSTLCDEKESMNYIGVAYEQGTGVDQDFEKAIEWYLKSIEGENISFYGKINYGFLLANGFGVEQNTDKALKIFEEVINSEDYYYDLDNVIVLAKEYKEIIINNQEGTLEKNKNYVDSFVCESVIINAKSGLDTSASFQKCLSQAQNKKDFSSQFYLGQLYQLGIGTIKDLNIAASWYKKSSNKSDDSKYNLAKLIQQGRLDNYQLIDAVELFEELKNNPIEAQKDSNYTVEASYELGIMYRHGVGIEKNLDLAKKYFEEIKEDETYYANLALKELDLIKAEKAGFYTKNNIVNFFPAEFNGIFKWENDNKISDINNFVFNNITQVGVSNFLLEGSYEIEDLKIEIRGFVDSDFNNIEIWEIGSKELVQETNQEEKINNSTINNSDSFDYNGSYVGFLDKNFTNLNAFWIPYSSGERGMLNLLRTNEIKSINRDREIIDNVNFGKYYALVIGNNNYEFMQPSLETAVADANAVAEVLSSKYGFEIIDVILDGNYKKIKGSLNNLKNIVKPYDNLLIYYAGHGHQDSDTGFWIPVDGADPSEDDDTYWISSDDISRAIGKISAKHILIIADSCYSGTLVERGGVSTSAKKEIDYYNNLLNKKARRALTSGANEPVVDGGGEGHSIFASAFLKILSNQNEIIETSALYTEIKKRVSNEVPQTPQYGLIPRSGDSGGEFIFVPIN